MGRLGIGGWSVDYISCGAILDFLMGGHVADSLSIYINAANIILSKTRL